MHGLDICKSSHLSGQYTDSSSIFLQIKTSRHRKAELLMNHSSASSEISFYGLPSKSKRPSIRKQIALLLSSQLIVLVFMKQPSAEKILASHQNTFRKVLESSQKNTRGEGQTPDTFFKKMFLERCSQNSLEKACVRDSILIKLHS